MIALDDLSFHIQRDTHATRSVCTVWYTYALSCSAETLEKPLEIWVDLWGDGLLRERALGDSVYDDHRPRAELKMTHARHFLVPCKILNEELGRDAIFLRLHVRVKEGSEHVWDSAVVHDNF